MEKIYRKDRFFTIMESQCLALAYGDVRLKTGYSSVSPQNVCLKSKFSANVTLQRPIVSAAMDTVTEHRMAIVIAQKGGLGVIHRAMTPEKQAAEVARVKFYLNGFIDRPIVVNESDTMGSITERNTAKGYGFSSFPVVNKSGVLVGVLTGTDFEHCSSGSLTAKEAMTVRPVTATKGIMPQEAFALMTRKKKKILPIVDKNGKLAGMYVFSDLKRILRGGGDSDFFNVDKNGHLRVAAAIGSGEEEIKRAEMLVREHVDVLVIDTAHADTADVLLTLRRLKKEFPSTDVVVGNVSEADSAKALADDGANGVKVGQGPGSICTTRIIAGVGCPQVTAVYNCVKALRGYDVPVCADGGIEFSGDIPIAIGAGAGTVMLGNLLAGTDEAPGEITEYQGRPVKAYRGMGSIGAMAANKAARERYRQSDTGKDGLIPEGVEGYVPYKGTVHSILHQLLEGLRRGMGYVGAANIEELQQKADFYRITDAGLAESHTHGIDIIKDAPNYWIKG